MNPKMVEAGINVLRQADGATVAAVSAMVTSGLIYVGARMKKWVDNRRVQTQRRDYQLNRQYVEDMSGDGGF